MNPIVIGSGQRAVAWTRASLRRLDRWRGGGAFRLGTVAGASLRTWLLSVAAAAVLVGVAAAALHVVLWAALRSGAGLGWLATAAVSAVAAVLLVIVARDTVLALAAPQRRRAHLTGFLMAAAALLATVQACAAATVAVGTTQDLWLAERLYAWHVADSVPLLAIPDNLEWPRPAVAVGSADRAILVVLTIALIVPLVRMVVSIYHLTGTAMTHHGGRVRALRRTRIVMPMVVSGAFVWGGASATIAGLSGFVLAGSLAGAVAAAIAIAFVLAIVVGPVKAAWQPISDGPWMQLVLAAGLVWIDTPVRHALLPASENLAAPWKFAVMLGLWAVLTVLLLPVWVDPQLPETLLALVMVLAFAATATPGSQRVAAAFGMTVGGFALGPAVAAGLAGLTGAYLVHLISRAPARAANADGSHLGTPDLRREILGYAYVGLQVVIAAAGLLMLLCGLGAVAATASMDAPRSLAATAWHLVNALPGNLPGTAGWHLAADFTGPWAGAVVVLTTAMLCVVVAFPMIRTTARWAKDLAGRTTPDRPLAEVPDSLLADLTAVRAFLTGPPNVRLDAAPAVEARLATAETDRRRLRQLVGEQSPLYWAAEQAISGAAEAYRKMAHAPAGRWSLWSPQEAGTADAVTAIDMYAAAVERWQMGEDVVAEIESRLRSIESREDGVQRREQEAADRQRVIDAREQGVEAREQMLVVRTNATVTREQTVEIRAAAVEARDQETQAREIALDSRDASVAARETDTALREQSVLAREEEVAAREGTIGAREQEIVVRERRAASRDQEIAEREHWVQAREQNADVREEAVVARERNAAAREREAEAGVSEPKPVQVTSEA